MIAWFRQLWAFALLLMRYWLRSGMPGSRMQRFRKGSAFIVRLAAIGAYVTFGRAIGQMSLRGAPGGIASVEWLVAGVVGFGVCWGMVMRARTLRGMAMPLAAPFIDALPVRDGARTVVEFFEVAVVHVMTATVFVTAAPALPTSTALGLGLATSFASAATGTALMRWVCVLAPPERAITAVQVSMFGQAAFLGLAFASQAGTSAFHPSFLSSLARPIAGEGGLESAFTFAGAAFLSALVALAIAERVGYDRGEVVPQKRFARAGDEDLTVGAIDELLARREPGARRWPFVVFGVFALAALAAWLVFVNDAGSQGTLTDLAPSFFVGMTGWMALSMASGIASRAVTRDLVARPFLSVLPIEPRQLLAGKIAVVRRRLLIGLVPLGFALLAPLSFDAWKQFAWRSVAVVAAAWIYGSAAVSVAFLTGGAQNARPQPGGTFRLESLLLLMPLGALLAARSPWTALVPLAALGLVSFEARRAATRVVRWLDDGEDFDRETPAWRAAIAFAAFQGAQALTAWMVTSWTTDPGSVLGASYGISAVVLAGLTAYGRRDLAPLRIWSKNLVAAPLALAGGIGTATFAHFIARFLSNPDADPGQFRVGESGQVATMLAVGLLAPLVEELFFRGWLQPVVARDLPPGRKWLAPVLSALAFASVHSPVSFPVVFSVGLVCSVLYARTATLGPPVIAHAAHNCIVMFWH